MAASACVIQLRVADPKVGTKLLPKDAVCELLDSLEQARVAWRPSQLCQWLLHITITDLIVNEAVKHSDHVPTMYESLVAVGSLALEANTKVILASVLIYFFHSSC